MIDDQYLELRLDAELDDCVDRGAQVRALPGFISSYSGNPNGRFLVNRRLTVALGKKAVSGSIRTVKPDAGTSNESTRAGLQRINRPKRIRGRNGRSFSKTPPLLRLL
jgi:hypothetical protein